MGKREGSGGGVESSRRVREKKMRETGKRKKISR